jgi:thymidylate kinase
MDVTRFIESRVIILEGVPGSGKTNLQERIRDAARGRCVSLFPEEALLFGWIHAWLPGIDALRMALMHRIIDHIQHTITKRPESLFVLTRFHISYLIFATMPDMEAYNSLISRLREIPVLVLVPHIPLDMIATRAVHVERADPLWRAHLDKRLAKSGFSDISSMYNAEQHKVQEILAAQQLQYEILDSTELEKGLSGCVLPAT